MTDPVIYSKTEYVCLCHRGYAVPFHVGINPNDKIFKSVIVNMKKCGEEEACVEFAPYLFNSCMRLFSVC